MENKYLIIPNSLIEKRDKDLLCAYMVAQYKFKKSGTNKVYLNSDVVYIEFDIAEFRSKKIIKMLEENYPVAVYKNGVILDKDIFDVGEQFWKIGDKEFKILIGEPAMMLHYVTILKNANELGECSYSIEMFAELEGCSVRSISNYNAKLVDVGLLAIIQRMDKSNVYKINDGGHRYCADVVEKYKAAVQDKVASVQGGVDSISYRNGMLNRFVRKEIHNRVKGAIKKEYRLMDVEDLSVALGVVDKYRPSVELRDQITMLNMGLFIDKIKFI